jgi:hypothetical protein
MIFYRNLVYRLSICSREANLEMKHKRCSSDTMSMQRKLLVAEERIDDS